MKLYHAAKGYVNNAIYDICKIQSTIVIISLAITVYKLQYHYNNNSFTVPACLQW